jgi:hypothetical protein
MRAGLLEYELAACIGVLVHDYPRQPAIDQAGKPRLRPPGPPAAAARA